MNRHLAAVSVLFMAVSAAAPPQDAPSDWQIIPGDRVGPITAETSEVMLERLYGADNVETADVEIGEGFTEPGTVVYPEDPQRRLEVVWLDQSRLVVKEVRLTGETSAWHTRDGISLGTTLKEIEVINRFPFRLAGFAWDYGGTIVGCGRGRLGMIGCADGDDDTESSRSRYIVIRLGPDVEARGEPAYRQVIGERVFSSGHPAMQKLNPRVYQIVVYLSQQ